MSDETARLKVEINQTSTGSGISDTSRDIKDLTAAQRAAAQSAQGNAKAVNELGEGFEKGAAAGRVLEQAAEGNVLALGQLGPIIKGLATLLKTNLIGALVTLGALAAGFAAPFIKGWMDSRDAAKAAADEIKNTEKAAAEAKKAAEDLGKAQMDILISNLDIIKRSSSEVDENFKSILGRAQQLDDAQRALDLAKIDANANLTEEQKVIARANVNTTFDARRAARPISAAEGKVGVARQTAEGTQGQAKQANDQVLAAQARVDELAGRRATLESEIASILAAWRKRDEEIIKNTFDGSERQSLLRKNQADAVAKTTPLAESLAILNGPEGKASETQAATALTEAKKRRDAANAEAQKADAELIKAEKELAAVREQQSKLIPLITETSRIKTAQEAAAARERDVAAGRKPAPAPTPGPSAAEVARAKPAGIVTVGEETPEQRARTAEAVARATRPADSPSARAALLAPLAGGVGAEAAGDVRNSPVIQSLGERAKAAAAALEKNPSIENINRMLTLLEQLGQGQADITNRLRTVESQIKASRTR